jgi:hypothetical protein
MTFLVDEPNLDRSCRRCHVIFKSRCRNVKYCPACRKAIKKERESRYTAKRKAAGSCS